MKQAEEIIFEAIETYNPVHVALMFSGGHDSLVNSCVSAAILEDKGIPFNVYHGDTTIGIPETQDYVKQVCKQFGWELVIRQPPDPLDHYESIVKKYGFPGPTKSSHQFMYRRLKERALRHWVTHEVKSSPKARENVLLLSGVRQDESVIRMGYNHTMSKDKSRCWANPIFYWTEERCQQYMKTFDLPRNPVKDKICISGECLCGAFASKEELTEIRSVYPHVAERIDELHELAKANGHPWPWTMGPKDWQKQNPPGQLKMFMCVGCEDKWTEDEQ